MELHINDLSTAGRPRDLIIAIINLKKVIAKKLELLEAIDAELEREYLAYDALEQLLDSGDYGNLTKADVVKAKQEIHSAIQHEQQAGTDVDKSIDKLNETMDTLGIE